jgi:hypothetical protein
MMQKLIARGQRIAAEVKARTIDRIAAQLGEQVRGVSVEAGSAGIELRGRRLLARWLNEPAMRFAAWRRP